MSFFGKLRNKLAAIGAPLEKVIWVEPNPRSLSKLKFNLERNPIPPASDQPAGFPTPRFL
jgi:hypothetical protein